MSDERKQETGAARPQTQAAASPQPDAPSEDQVGEQCVALIRGLDDHHAQTRVVRRLRDEFGG